METIACSVAVVAGVGAFCLMLGLCINGALRSVATAITDQPEEFNVDDVDDVDDGWDDCDYDALPPHLPGSTWGD